jgi:glycosyltransferase involved in cell wall biosynthesis
VTPVAVIIPCHDDGPLAEEAIASIQERERIEVELVVVNDGSTDPETLDRLVAIEQAGVRIVHRENGGLGAARTTGLEATSAPFVYPLDADDLLEAGALRTMVDVLEANSEAGFTWGDYAVFGSYDGRYRSPERFLPWTLTYLNPYPVSSMFRREVLERAGGWRGWAYEDWDLWLRLVALGVTGVATSRVVYRRRLHGDSRLLVQARRRHHELYREIVRRNSQVIARRKELLAMERPALWKRLVYPTMFGARSALPVPVEAFLIRTMLRRGGGMPG